jgi:hypothetical protein
VKRAGAAALALVATASLAQAPAVDRKAAARELDEAQRKVEFARMHAIEAAERVRAAEQAANDAAAARKGADQAAADARAREDAAERALAEARRLAADTRDAYRKAAAEFDRQRTQRR